MPATRICHSLHDDTFLGNPRRFSVSTTPERDANRRFDAVQPALALSGTQVPRWILISLVVVSASEIIPGCESSGSTGSSDSSPSPPAGTAASSTGGSAGASAPLAGAGGLSRPFGTGGLGTGGADASGAADAAAGGAAGGADAAGNSADAAQAGASGNDTADAGGSSTIDPATTQAGCQANPFALTSVTLDESDFTANRDRTLAYLRSVDIESLLSNFRATVGLPTNNATPPRGWEAPSSNLRGHATGHVLKALAQAYAGTGDEQYKTKADALLNELKKCQDLAESKGFGAGYLSAYPPEQFIKLESLAQYPSIWAPYYTLHKILAGLIASYELTDNKTALDMAKMIGQWVNNRLSKLDRAQLQRMWNLYIAGETGGINESLAELYEITGDQLYLKTAALFDKDLILDSCSANRDELNGLHANQHIPTITGYMRMYHGTQNDKYLKTAQNFWSMVTTNHIYAIGGTGEAEMFGPPGEIAGALTEKTAETCATYNMLKLTRQLFCYEPNAKYMDYYERGLYNHILGSQNPNSRSAAVTYFMPLRAGASRTYDDTFTCCHGTGMENHTKYQGQIYSFSTDGTTLYVNLYIPSTLNWADKGFQVKQTTGYPYQPSSKLTFEGAGPLRVALRIPGWATQGVQIQVNGQVHDVAALPGTYAVVDRTWASGDEVELQLPFNLRIEKTPDNPSLGAILYGPSVIVALSNTSSTIRLDADESILADVLLPTGEPLTFSAGNVTYEPFSKATNTAYHTYFGF
ncbi:MAG: glycoside hydrolase family 127 protein [Deltaproteobacteria bacterium]|nr:glycoside hydrolase family 127 protein [Deltaproteobacteria bacterium]